MAQYCDSKELERTWFNWLLASDVPALEDFRTQGLLWTKVVGISRNSDGDPIIDKGQPLLNPIFPIRAHCIATAAPVYLISQQGVPQQIGVTYHNGKPVQINISEFRAELNLISDSNSHCLSSHRLSQQLIVIPELKAAGYIKEVPTKRSWHSMLIDISKICSGVSTKFKLINMADEQADLASDALAQVIQKLITRKLVYIPGKAPVFNLLTTTIHRCMCSTLNRKNNQRDGLNRLLSEVKAGNIPNGCSFKIQPHTKIKT